MNTRSLLRKIVSKDAIRRFATRPPRFVVAAVTLGLSMTRIAEAQSNPSSEPIASFPEQSNTANAPAVPSAATQVAPSTTATDSPTPSVVPATNQPTHASNGPSAATAITAPVVATSTSAVTPAATPTPDVPSRPSRDGFYFRFGSGSSFLRLKGTGPKGAARITGLGSGVTIALGGAIARGLVLSGAIHAISTTGDFKGGPFRNAEVNADGKTVDASSRATASFAEIAALVDYYPSVIQGWHVGAGIGIASSSIVNSADDSAYYATGFGALVQGGYEWHLGKDWCLGINLVASGATKGDFKESEHQTATDYSLRTLSIGVQSALVYF